MGHLGFCLVVTLPLLAGCASNSCHTTAGNSSITPSEVSAAGRHVGKSARWGGTLVEAQHLEDSTELEVVAYPLDSCGRPRTGSSQTGRFIIVHPGFLETTDYQTGRQVSATGRITGIRQGRGGNVDQSVPLLRSYKVSLWPDKSPGAGYSRPWVNIGIGGGGGGVYGGVGVIF